MKGPVALNQPVAVYNNWSAYDELSDNIRLTETLAMKELREIARLHRLGVRIDYYVMDAFWYSTNGGYRKFREPDWPNGPDEWLRGCREIGVKPGLWVASNVPFRLEVIPEWRSSMDATGSAMCLFDGGFLPQFISTMQFWYDKGVRLFKFDFANFTIATPQASKNFTPAEVFEKNCVALRAALRAFKSKNPEVLLTAFNGFGGDTGGTFAPVRQTVDLHWLDTFDSLYCGDPRFSDVPTFNVWRSMDVYTDHMVRYYEANGVPLERIDNTGCMFGVAGTCYARRTSAWQSMLLLEHARGGWMNVYYGNLELLDDQKAKWFARVQDLYFPLQSFGRTYSFGSMPGLEQPYGFCSAARNGSVYTVVNPSQAVRTITLPRTNREQPAFHQARVLFKDAGFVPRLMNSESPTGAGRLTLGPEQLAVVGCGEYAKAKYDLGVQADVLIPQGIRSLPAHLEAQQSNSIKATLAEAPKGDLRIVMRQFAEGTPFRTSRGAPPNGTHLDKVFVIQVMQSGRPIPVELHYDKAVWSGLSWATGQVSRHDFNQLAPLEIRCESKETRSVDLKLELYEVTN
ncbi:MAG TPA: hypothetical protein VKY92_09385 [Verrucomicrobiae bacterium]|nr:hypothetical protein [Verrucomicrobiae bacterium]